jgi:hypothetical protein
MLTPFNSTRKLITIAIVTFTIFFSIFKNADKIIQSFKYFFYDYPNYSLNIIEEHFAIDGFSAIQGLDIFNSKNNKTLFMANGYRNSIGIYENKTFSGLPIKSKVLDEPELIAGVYYNPNYGAFWTAWRNNEIYITDKNFAKTGHKVWAKNLNMPLGITGSKDHLYLANHGAHEIIKYNYDGSVVWKKKFYIDGIELKSVYGIKDFNNNLLVSFQKPFAVAIIDYEGNIINHNFGKFNDGLTVDGSSFNNLQGVDFDAKDNIYAIDSYNKRIVIMDKDLNFIATATHPDIANSRGISIDRIENHIYISGFKEGLEVIETQTGFWIFEVPNLN